MEMKKIMKKWGWTPDSILQLIASNCTGDCLKIDEAKNDVIEDVADSDDFPEYTYTENILH